jgi:hypothetical protein
MKRTTLFLDEQLEHELRALSKRKGLPLASLVREAMAQYVAAEKQRGRAPVRFVASGRSGHTDTAERQEDLLWGDLDPHGRPAPVVAKPVRARRRVSARRPRARRR